VNNNTADFTTGAPVPRNSASAPAICGCTALNESNLALEADYCTVQFPSSIPNGVAGSNSPLVYGRVYEGGTTEPAGVNASVRAQLGYGPPSANPQYQAGWTWTNATYNTAFVDPSTDEYQASFVTPASGSYRYVYRFSLDQGVSWTYCGTSGAGQNFGLTFGFYDEPILTVP
jgi:hypothetical protein